MFREYYNPKNEIDEAFNLKIVKPRLYNTIQPTWRHSS